MRHRIDFYVWLADQTQRADPVGDLARDALSDELRPQDSRYTTCKRFLWLQGASDNCMRAFERAYGEYRGLGKQTVHAANMDGGKTYSDATHRIPTHDHFTADNLT